MKLNQPVIIIRRDPDLIGSAVVPEPKLGIRGKYRGIAPVPGKVEVEFRATALGYSYDEENPTITLYLREACVGPVGSQIDETPMEPIVSIEDQIVAHQAEIDAELAMLLSEPATKMTPELEAIWEEAEARVAAINAAK